MTFPDDGILTREQIFMRLHRQQPSPEQVGCNRDYPHYPQMVKLWKCEARFALGNPLALIDGLTLCNVTDTPPPPWMVNGISAYLHDGILGLLKGDKGRNNSPFGKLNVWLSKLRQAEVVKEIRDWQQTFPAVEEISCDMVIENAPAFLSNESIGNKPKLQKALNQPQRAKTYATELAWHVLSGTWAQASRKSILTSYLEVSKFPLVRPIRYSEFIDNPIAFWVFEWSEMLPCTKALMHLDGNASDGASPLVTAWREIPSKFPR
jgi:hypothetical protein